MFGTKNHNLHFYRTKLNLNKQQMLDYCCTSAKFQFVLYKFAYRLRKWALAPISLSVSLQHFQMPFFQNIFDKIFRFFQISRRPAIGYDEFNNGAKLRTAPNHFLPIKWGSINVDMRLQFWSVSDGPLTFLLRYSICKFCARKIWVFRLGTWARKIFFWICLLYFKIFNFTMLLFKFTCIHLPLYYFDIQ